MGKKKKRFETPHTLVIIVCLIIIAAVATNTDENSLVKPLLRISGTSILASIAASARPEPDKPPIRVATKIVT